MAGSGEIYKRSDERWGFRVKTEVGDPVAIDSGHGYVDKAEARGTLEMLLRGEFDGPIQDAVAVQCGAEITQDTTLDSDLVCDRGPALVITADNVTLDLGGHSVTGTPGGGGPGILLREVTGVTVQNGTVERFGAGIVIQGGSGNVVQNLTIMDNVGSPDGDFGDGIVVSASFENRILNNTVARNGPYSGIALARDAQHNEVRNNVVTDNNMMHVGEPSAGRQCMGIRIEGPAANHNQVVGNRVSGSGANGIALLATCVDDMSNPPCIGSPPNEQNEITGNTCERNGTSGRGDGITVFSLPNPITPVHNQINENHVHDNTSNGISIQAVGNNNVGSTENRAARNHGRNNKGFDGFDGNTNPPCATNVWEENDFGTVNQPCVRGAHHMTGLAT